jgi:hypothetical protein
MSNTQTLINGDRYDFTTISVNANGNDITKGAFKSINYGGSQEPGIVQGNRSLIMGLTPGYGLGDGSFTMFRGEFDDFNDDLTENGNIPTTLVDFVIIVQYSVNDVDVSTDTIYCRIKKVDLQNSQGSDASMVACDLTVRRLKLNGNDVFGEAE